MSPRQVSVPDSVVRLDAIGRRSELLAEPWRRSCRRRRVGALPLALVVVLLLACGARPALAAGEGAGGTKPVRTSIASLPAPLQGALSAKLGGDDPAFRVVAEGTRYRADNGRHGLSATMGAEGSAIRAGGGEWRLGPPVCGRGESLEAAASGTATAAANRVEVRRGRLVEWWVNGPLGLEQGWTVTARPRGDGPLTLAVAQSGSLRAASGANDRALAITDAAGRTVLRYGGLAASDAIGRELPARFEVTGDAVRVRVDDAGADYPIRIDPWLQTAELTASDGPYAMLGYWVAVSGDGSTVVAGAPARVIGGNSYQGAVYVFIRPTTGWADATQTAELTVSDGATNDGLGQSVAVSGDGSTVVAGAPGRQVGAVVYQGAAYVFVRPAGGWVNATQTAELTASDGAVYDGLGWSVAVSGDGATVIAGAEGHSPVGGYLLQGAAYAFVKPTTGWANATQTAELTASDGDYQDQLGLSVAVSGDGSTVVAGALLHRVRGNSFQGAGYVFVKPAGGWSDATQTAQLTASDGAQNDELGVSVAVSDDGSTAAAGAWLHKVGGNVQGAAYVFIRPPGGWADTTQTGELTASDGAPSDRLGTSVAISGDSSVVVAGARDHQVGSNAYQGAAYVFVRPVTGWANGTQTAELTALDGATSDSLGWSSAVNGNGATVVSGAIWHHDGANTGGAAYVFEPVGGTLSGTVTSAVSGNPIAGVLVKAGAWSALTDGNGVYTLTLPGGTYDVTASKFGYMTAIANGVVVAEGNTTTQDFALFFSESSDVDGYVTDAGHGWPLYAKIDIVWPVIGTQTIYTDPFTGYFNVALMNGYDYTFTVTALTPGYDPQVRVVSVAGVDQTQSFALRPTTPACAVPGYGPPPTGSAIFSENFDSVTAPTLPPGWETVNVGNGGSWFTNAGVFYWGAPAHSAPNVVAIDNYNIYYGQTRLDRTVGLDLSAATSPLLGFWMYHDSGYCQNEEAASVQAQVSTDGGSTWNNVGDPVYFCNGTTGWTQHYVSLGNYKVADVRIGFLDTSDWYNAISIDDISVFEAQPCTPLNGALVAGFVTDANTNTGLVGATVANDLGASTTTVNDPEEGAGFYLLFTPIPPFNGPSLRTFTASMKHYANSSVQKVLIPNTVNRLDFVLQAGWLELSPTSLWSRLYPGQIEDQFLTLTNMGSLTANYKLFVSETKTTWPHLSWVKPGAPHVKVASTARAKTAGHPAAKPADVPQLAFAPAYGLDVSPGSRYMNWPDITAPGTWNTVAYESGAAWFGGTFLGGDSSKEYVVDYNSNTLNTVDTTTGAVTVIGPSVPGGGESWTGLTAAPDGTMYGAATTCSSSTLYTVDPTTGATTAVGPITNAPCIIDIAANSAGELYGVDIINDVLVKVDPATGAGTVIGSTGVNANYAQGLSFDQTTDTLYWAAYTTGGELRVIDTSTGASTLIGAFPGGAEVDAFAIVPVFCCHPWWVVVSPTAGTVAPAASSQVDALFIADAADHFGLFRATIKTSTDTPYSVNDVSVCFSKAFLDVPAGYWADAQINAIAGARITTGCGIGNFCPDNVMTRGTMARWLLMARHGNLYAPPPCTGIFADVPCETTPNASYIEELYNEGITAGCATDPLRYCPDSPVTRAQMSVFIMKASQAPGYTPPDCFGLFADVACPGGFAVKWIEDLYNHQITAGCGTNPLIFCPDNSTTRAQEAVFVDKAWSIPKCPAPPGNPTR